MTTRATGNAKAFDCMVLNANMHYYLVAGGGVGHIVLRHGVIYPFLIHQLV